MPNDLGLHHLPVSNRTVPMAYGECSMLHSPPDIPEDFDEEPPALPSHLQLTFLNVPPFDETMGSFPLLNDPSFDENKGSSSRPQDVYLNHIYVEIGENLPSVLALSSTLQYRSKYVTIALYKPIQK
jgi:hypothetical protein